MTPGTELIAEEREKQRKAREEERLADESMNLPEGKTCSDCYAFTRFCGPLGISTPERTRCDYYPRRFAELQRAQQKGGG